MLTTRSTSGLEGLPNLLSFDFKPQRGPNLSVWWINTSVAFRDWGKEEEAFKNVATNTTMGTIIGVAIGAFLSLLGVDTPSAPPQQKLKEYTLIGGIIGGVSGMARGIIQTQRLFLERPIVIKATLESSEKAKKVFQAFISSQEELDILCPIGYNIMIYPVKTRCSSNTPHYFDYFKILGWLDTGNTTCPICRRDIAITDLTYAPEKELEIHEKVASIFQKMEAILERFPGRFMGCDDYPHFSDTEQIKTLAAKIKNGEQLLEGTEEEIAQKIQQPETLSDKEALALAFFLIHQMRPLKDKIKKIFNVASEHLLSLHKKDVIDTDTYQEQVLQLNAWHTRWNTMPKRCQILDKLYS